MFSKTCEYAIRALILIAHNSGKGRKVGVKEIAAGIDAPEYFIAKILNDLVRKNLLQSIKGPSGGFYLDKESLRNSLADIVRAVDGDKLFSGCGMGLDYCSAKKPCPLHNDFKKMRDQLSAILRKSILGQIKGQLDLDNVFIKQR